MLLLLPAMRLGVILLLAGQADGRGVHVDVSLFGHVGHHGPRQRSCQKAKGIRSWAFGDEEGLAFLIGGDAGIIEGDAEVRCVPRDGGVTVSHAT